MNSCFQYGNIVVQYLFIVPVGLSNDIITTTVQANLARYSTVPLHILLKYLGFRIITSKMS